MFCQVGGTYAELLTDDVVRWPVATTVTESTGEQREASLILECEVVLVPATEYDKRPATYWRLLLVTHFAS